MLLEITVVQVVYSLLKFFAATMGECPIDRCLITEEPKKKTITEPAMSRPVDAPLIAEMLRQHGAALELFAAQWTTAAEDCVQDALVKLAGQAVMPKNPRAWLYRVVRNRALNMARSANRREAHEQVAARLHAKDHPAVDVAEVGDALATLPDDAREAIVLRVWGELTWEEIATVAGSSSSTMQRRYTEGLRALREIWEVETCPTNTESPAS